MKREIQLLLTALQFYTRIPVPQWNNYSDKKLNLATRYLPVIGWLAGLTAALTFWAGTYLADATIGVVFSVIATVLLTGAFHEDGFADTCDGFGGGWTKDKILLIMKDSRIGTYGTVGLILLFALKFALLINLANIFQNQIFAFSLLLVNAHTTSRFMAATVIFTTTYARDTDDSKSKPVAQKPGTTTMLTATFFSILPLLLLASISQNFWIFIFPVPLYIVRIFLVRYFEKWIGGYTGDCLGAIQQTTEVLSYLLFLIIWKFI